MRLKNRNLYSIEISTSAYTGRGQVVLNFGENRYATCTMADFFRNVGTWKIAKEGKRGGQAFVPILENSQDITTRNRLLIDLIAMAEHFIDIKGEVVNLKHGSYLLETDDFVPLRNGKIAYMHMESYKGHTIKFNLNGVYGFSVWKGTSNLEDNLWSIDACKKCIDEMQGGAQ